MHSFMNHICYDHRLNVKMSSLATTYLNPVIEFQMRVFRFRDPTEPAHTKQEQDIVCEIYLEEAESTYEEKQCECYTPDECNGKSPPGEVTQPSSTKTTSTTTTKTTPATATKTTPITTPTTTTRTFVLSMEQNMFSLTLGTLWLEEHSVGIQTRKTTIKHIIHGEIQHTKDDDQQITTSGYPMLLLSVWVWQR